MTDPVIGEPDAALKLTTYFGERKRAGDRFIGEAVLEAYQRHGLTTSVLLRGVEGFGRKHHLRSDSTLTLSEDLPAVAIGVDTEARIDAVLPTIEGLMGDGLITLERAYLQVGELHGLTLPERLHEATKLTVYLGRQQRVGRRAAYVAVCDLLHRRGILGATVLLGVDGTVRGSRERASFFGRNADVPMTVLAVGTGAHIADVLPDLGRLLPRPIVTLERVRVCKRDGELLAAPHELPGTDDHGRPLSQKLTVYTSEAQLHDGRPIHRAITRELRRGGAAGVTTLRGVWGFHGAHAPHGDRVFQYGRHVPTVTIVIDAPDRIGAAFAVIDELTRDRGLVTSEMVPALRNGSGGEATGGLGLADHPF